MSERTKFDRKLKDFMVRSTDLVGALVFNSEDATAHKVLALRDLAKGQEILEPAVVTAIKENHDVYLASGASRQAENAVENAFEPFSLSLEKVRIERVLANPEEGAALTDEMKRIGAAMTPPSFRALGLDRTLSVGKAAVAFAESHLEEDNPHLVKMSDALGVLSQARTRLGKEEGEASNAMRALETARDQAKTYYVAARDALRGGLRIAGRPEPLRQFMLPLRQIYGSNTTQHSDSPDADAPALTPATESDPQPN